MKLLVPVLAALLTWGCALGEPDEPSTSGPDAIVVASSTDMRGVNELTADVTQLHSWLHNFVFFATLLEEQPDFETGPPTFTPRLAESYEFSDDRKSLTFRLRDMTWSDGTPLTAEDVRWTWQAQTHPDVAWGLADAKRFIRDVEVVDPRTARFHFEKVYATQLIDANLGVILPRHAWSRIPFSEWRARADWFRENLVVSGPFTLGAWEPDQRIVLERNERYFKPGLPRADRIVLRVTPDRASQLALLRSGEVQMIDWARPADAKALMAEPDIELRIFSGRSVVSLVWNALHPYFAHKQVRQALTMAIDRQSIIEALYYGFADFADSPYPSKVWVFNQDLEPWPHDPERARELLAAEGWSDRDGDGVLDRDGERFSFEILTVSGNELRQDILVMVQDQLRRLGIEVRQRPLEFNTFLDRSRRHEFEAVLMSVALGTNLDLTPFLHSIAIDEGYNFGSYSNPGVDRLIDEVKQQIDQDDAKASYDRLQVLLHEELPMTVLYEPLRLVPVRKELQGTSPNALSNFFGIEHWELAESRD